MSKVFVVDQQKKPLDPIHAAQARILLRQDKAVVLRTFPFVIMLRETAPQPISEPLRLKIDPGSKHTGMAVVNDNTGEVVFALEITHRGEQIKEALDKRRAVRRNRRARKTRYRQARFNNRRRPKGWLPPSLVSPVANIMTWVERLSRYCPIASISMELVKFDLQKMQNPEISALEYQQGTLHGYEVREYLLEKWERKCVYCDKKDIALQIEHICAKSRGGTDRISNLTLACARCNQKKGNQDVQLFLVDQPQRLRRILAEAKTPLKDATSVNATRWELYRRLVGTGLEVECGSGGLTKYNRSIRNMAKSHWIDAANTGASTPAVLNIGGVRALYVEAKGHGNRQMCRVNKYGFPRTRAKQARVIEGFRSGDIVRANVPEGKKTGSYIGRVSIRTNGSFNIATARGIVQGISYRYCRIIHKGDGYSYGKGVTAVAPQA